MKSSASLGFSQNKITPGLPDSRKLLAVSRKRSAWARSEGGSLSALASIQLATKSSARINRGIRLCAVLGRCSLQNPSAPGSLGHVGSPLQILTCCIAVPRWPHLVLHLERQRSSTPARSFLQFLPFFDAFHVTVALTYCLSPACLNVQRQFRTVETGRSFSPKCAAHLLGISDY